MWRALGAAGISFTSPCGCPSAAKDELERIAVRWMQVWNVVSGHTFPSTSGSPLRPSQTRKNTSNHPAVLQVVSTASYNFTPSRRCRPTGRRRLSPRPKTPRSRRSWAGRDVPVSHLHNNGVSEHSMVDTVEPPAGPLRHLFDLLVGDPEDGLHADGGTIVLGRCAPLPTGRLPCSPPIQAWYRWSTHIRRQAVVHDVFEVIHTAVPRMSETLKALNSFWWVR